MSRRDWTYLLSLLVPFLLYDLVLKGSLVVSWPKDLGFAESLGLMRSDLLFSMGYALLWLSLFAVVRKGLWRRMVTILFHASTILVALLATIAYQYFKVTGSTLDFGFILISLSSPGGLAAVIESEVSPGVLALLAAVLAYAVLGPFLVTRLDDRWRGRLDASARTPGVPWLRVAGVGVAACALFALSLLPGASGSTGGPSKSFSRDALAHVAVSAARAEEGEGIKNRTVASGEQAPEASLRATGEPERRNVVLVHLESTRAQSMTPYNEELESSLLAERAYAVVPHTTNAMAATNCGMSPPLNPWQTASLGNSIPARCLADLLEEQRYSTVWFTSSVSTFEIERLPELVENLGYEEFYPVEIMDTEGFERRTTSAMRMTLCSGRVKSGSESTRMRVSWLHARRSDPTISTWRPRGATGAKSSTRTTRSTAN